VLLPDGTAQAGRVNVATLPETLLIDLRPEQADLGVQRSLIVSGTCEERARSVAVVIATWWPVEPARSTEVAFGSGPAGDTVGKGGQRLELGAVGFASVVSEGVAPGLGLEAQWLPWSRTHGLRLALSGTGSHGGALGQGQAHWQRAGAEAGFAYARGALSLDAGGVAGVVRVQCSGFAGTQSSTGMAFGATAGGRVGWRLGRHMPYVSLRALFWPQAQRMVVFDPAADVEASRTLPHWEAQIGAGIAYSVF
jgi:hypothetical protein